MAFFCQMLWAKHPQVLRCPGAPETLGSSHHLPAVHLGHDRHLQEKAGNLEAPPDATAHLERRERSVPHPAHDGAIPHPHVPACREAAEHVRPIGGMVLSHARPVPWVMIDHHQHPVWRDVARNGALTVRRVTAAHGPQVNWRHLLSAGWLRVYETRYGAVLAVGPAARTWLRAHPADRSVGWVPYIAGPASVADRAYQMDAIDLLVTRGYTFIEHHYKRTGTVTKAAHGRAVTSQIVRSMMRVPEREMRAIHANYGPGRPPVRDGNYHLTAARGHPFLYATISNGGIRLPRLAALYAKHKDAVTGHWFSPLLVALPDGASVHSYVRRMDTEQRRILGTVHRSPGQPPLVPYPVICVIQVPLSYTPG
jgi:hypothetical protein